MLFALLTSLPLSASLAVQDTTPHLYPGRGAPAVEIPRIESSAVVDGQLNEPAWSQAARLTGFSQFQPVDSRPAEEETEVRVWYAPDAIWFGIIAKDRIPESVHATVANRDNLDTDDNVRIYLDTFDDRRRAYFFGVNPLGAQEDGVRTEGASSPGSIFGGSIDRTPDLIWQSKGQRTPEGYIVEIRIPFKSLRTNGGTIERWGIQIVRETRRTGYEDTWTDAKRASATFLDQAGRLSGIHDIHRGVVLEAQPTFTSAWNGARDPGTGSFDRADPTSDLGLNLRLGFTSTTLDGTYNPDFSQVEADAGQVTLNQRFALFFPERRQFFLEGIELFSTPNQLVYTRTVNDPRVGVKLTGKTGGTTFAYLGAVDEQPGPDAVVNVARARRDFGGNSFLGLTATDRTIDGAFNRLVSTDVRYVFGGMYYFAPQIGVSWTRDSTGAPTRSDRGWVVEHHHHPVARRVECHCRGHDPVRGVRLDPLRRLHPRHRHRRHPLHSAHPVQRGSLPAAHGGLTYLAEDRCHRRGRERPYGDLRRSERWEVLVAPGGSVRPSDPLRAARIHHPLRHALAGARRVGIRPPDHSPTPA